VKKKDEILLEIFSIKAFDIKTKRVFLKEKERINRQRVFLWKEKANFQGNGSGNKITVFWVLLGFIRVDE